MPANLLDVLVVGAGPVGLFCANELTRQGLQCRIVDKKAGLSDKSKALAIHIRSLDLLEDCGFFETFEAQGHKVEGLLIKSNNKELIVADLSELKTNYHFLIDLPQDKTERIFYKGLKEKGLDVQWNTELTRIEQCPTNVIATLNNADGSSEELRASWVIACDGAHSTLRKLLYADFNGSSYAQTWWLADLLIDWEMPDNKMIAYLSDEGPLACFPIGNKRYRVVMTAPKKTDWKEPSMKEIEEVFMRRCSDKASLSDPIWLSQFGIAERQIQKYRYQRVFFAGDAAHIHSPMGGQGLNTGLQDIYNLAWKLALVQKGFAKEQLLDSYQFERYPIAKKVLRKTGLMTKMVMARNPLLVSLRNRIIHSLNSIKLIKNFILRDLAELDISYANSPLSKILGNKTAFKIGEYLNDFRLNNAESHEEKFLSQIIQGTRHHLFLFAGVNNSRLQSLKETAKIIEEFYDGLIKTHLVLSEPSDLSTEHYSVWLDPNCEVQQRFLIPGASALMIRPDKYLSLTQAPFNQDELLHHLEKGYINKAKKAEYTSPQ